MVLQKAPCQNRFKVIEAALLSSKACDITGIVAIACARHGCFVPNAMADLFAGEQQKNIDWILLQALRHANMDIEQAVMLIYDIVCQYFKYLYDRIGTQLPPDLQIDRAIGLFHVHGHKDECFFRYATSFIPGAAITAGEILETLWASMNAISSTMRTASLAHRAETLDEHATDSNHRKLLGMVAALCKRYRHAAAMSTTTTASFDGLTRSLDAADHQIWEEEIRKAESN